MTGKNKTPDLILKPIVRKKIVHPLLVPSAVTKFHCNQSRFPQLCPKPINFLPSNPSQTAFLLTDGSKQRAAAYLTITICLFVCLSVDLSPMAPNSNYIYIPFVGIDIFI